VHTAEHNRTVVVVEIAAGAMTIGAIAAVGAVVVPATEPVGRVLILAVAVAVLAARFTRWSAAVTTAVLAAVAFACWPAPQAGVTADSATAWAFTPVFGFALMVGHGYRILTVSAHPEPAAGDVGRTAKQPSRR
jgi:hypothetical protein